MKVRTLQAAAAAARLRSVALLAVLPLALGACASDRVEPAEAQNPMGDEAIASFAAEVEGSGTDATPPAAPARLSFGSSMVEAAACMERRIADLHGAAADSSDASRASRHAGESASFAIERGWYPAMPEFRDGVLLPCSRVVAYYGHPNSTRMGALGEFPKDEMLRRLMAQVAEWEAADPTTPVIPALHMVAVVAQGEPGTSGRYRTISADERVQTVYDWAREVDGVLFVDIQVGTDDIRNILPRFEWILKNPDVHLGVDPEFMMKDGSRPGSRIGTMDAADINYVTDYLARLVREHGLPPKVFILHRFTRRMVTNYQNIQLRPEVQIVNHMDGWGAPWLKRDTWRDQMVREPIQFSGFKVFYHNDTKKGDPLMTPADLLRLHPVPLYVQYQ